MASSANDAFDNSLPISNIFRIVGGWGGVSGPSVFMVRCIVVGTGAGAVMGMACASIGSMLTGVGTLPFIVGAALGFTGSVISHYQTSLRQAFIALDRYPALMLLHLHANYPVMMEYEIARKGPFIAISNYERLEIESDQKAKHDESSKREVAVPIPGQVGQVGLNLRERFQTWQMKSVLIIAWMTAGTALDEIHGRSESYLVEKYAEARRDAEEARLNAAMAKLREE